MSCKSIDTPGPRPCSHAICRRQQAGSAYQLSRFPESSPAITSIIPCSRGNCPRQHGQNPISPELRGFPCNPVLPVISKDWLSTPIRHVRSLLLHLHSAFPFSRMTCPSMPGGDASCKACMSRTIPRGLWVRRISGSRAPLAQGFMPPCQAPCPSWHMPRLGKRRIGSPAWREVR
jgi:hypothetical protein